MRSASASAAPRASSTSWRFASRRTNAATSRRRAGRLAFHASGLPGEGAHPARARVGALRDRDQHAVPQVAGGDQVREAFEERLAPAPPALRLAQQHEPARREHRQRAQRVLQRRGAAALAVQPVEVEVARPVAEHRALERAPGVLAQQGLGAGQQIGRTQPAARELSLELVGAHGTLRSKSESCTRPARMVATRRIASTRFLRIVSMSALAK